MRKHLAIFCCLVLCLELIPFGYAQAGCALPINTPYAAIALFKPALHTRLFNSAVLKDLCPTGAPDCTAQALAPYTDKIPVYDAPSGHIIASLNITYTPDKGITAVMVQGPKTIPYTPPIYDADFGYGPWYHATLLDQNGPWQNIALPSIQSGWVNMPDADVIRMDKMRTDENLGIYTLNGRNIVPVTSSNTALTVRDEQPAHDMFCDIGTPPALAPFKTQSIPLDKLYDDACNLLLVPAYMRGC